jgi:all-trans-retinol 13,14-reductase
MAEVKDSYDVVVVGGGIGGLTCGAILAKNRQNVLVVEQGDRPGGYCSSFEHRDYVFDRGLRFLRGCELGGALYEALDGLGLRERVELMKMKPCIRLIGPDYDFRITSVEDLGDRLIDMFPAEVRAVHSLTTACKAVAMEMEGFSRESPDLMSLVQKLALPIANRFRYRNIARYRRRTWQQVVESLFSDPKLRVIMLTMLPSFDPGVMAPLPMALLGTREDFYYPKGGAQALANVLAEGLRSYGGDLALNTRVDRIRIEQGRAVGVNLNDGRQVKASHVVSNGDARETFLKLVGEEHLRSRFSRKLNQARLSESAFMVSLGVSLNLKAMGFDGANIVFNPSDNMVELFGADPAGCTISINIHSILEPSQVPNSNTALQLVAMLPYESVEDWDAAEQDVAYRLIASAAKVVPGLADHIACKHIVSPSTWEPG